MAEKPEVAVPEVNTINIKHVESDLKMYFDEADFSVEICLIFIQNEFNILNFVAKNI